MFPNPRFLNHIHIISPYSRRFVFLRMILARTSVFTLILNVILSHLTWEPPAGLCLIPLWMWNLNSFSYPPWGVNNSNEQTKALTKTEYLSLPLKTGETAQSIIILSETHLKHSCHFICKAIQLIPLFTSKFSSKYPCLCTDLLNSSLKRRVSYEQEEHKLMQGS